MLGVISKFQLGQILEVKFYYCFSMDAEKYSGELFDVIFHSIYDTNKLLMVEKAILFGIRWLKNGATMKRMPLLNVLAIHRGRPIAAIAILDYTGCMVDGGKKTLTSSNQPAMDCALINLPPCLMMKIILVYQAIIL